MTTETKPRIQQLKEQAAKLGITHSPNIGVDTLDNKIKGHLAQLEQINQPSEHDLVEKKIKEATKLVRIIATCMDHTKTEGERQGEYVMGGNSVTGTLKKFIPYGHPVHIEQLLLNVLKEKKFQQRFGVGNQNYREVQEFAIQILPDLTPEEVEELKKVQALRAEAASMQVQM